MTLGILRRYFLKVGNSYNNPQELERDMRDHGRTEKYHSRRYRSENLLEGNCDILTGKYAETLRRN